MYGGAQIFHKFLIVILAPPNFKELKFWYTFISTVRFIFSRCYMTS